LIRALFYIASFAFIAFSSQGQESLEFLQPVKLPGSINSKAEESTPLLAPGGGTIYFSRILYAGNVGGEKAGQDIWYSSKNDTGGWSDAMNNLNKLNNKNDNAVIGIGADGITFYLLNNNIRKGKMAIESAMLENRIWSEPQDLYVPGLNSGSGLFGFYMHPGGEILLISMEGEGSVGKEDLYVSTKNEEAWSEPVHLGNIVNTTEYEIAPFLDDDATSLYFSSQGHEGIGDADIFVSKRLDESWTNWSDPINLGEPVNSTGFDAFFTMNSNGEAVFASNRSGSYNDIFYTKLRTGEEVAEVAIEVAIEVEVDAGADVVEEIVEEIAGEAIEETAEESTKETADESSGAEAKEEEAVEKVAEEAIEEVAEESTEEVAVEVAEEAVEEAVEEVAEEEAEKIAEEVAEEAAKEAAKEAAEETVEEVIEKVAEEAEEVVEESTEGAVEKAAEEVAGETAGEATEEVAQPEEKVEQASDTYSMEEMKQELAARKKKKEEVRTSATASRGVASNTIYFDHNSSYMNESAKANLQQLAVELKRNSGTSIEVAGYTDDSGTDHYNMWMAERRSNRVKDFLIAEGVNASILTATWHGTESPAAKCSDCSEDENQKNRRVEIYFK